jgi:CBS domain-containing protein
MSNPLADVEKFLEETPPFDLLDPERRHRAAAAIEVVYRRKGTVLLEVGDSNETLYIIRRDRRGLRPARQLRRSPGGESFIAASPPATVRFRDHADRGLPDLTMPRGR